MSLLIDPRICPDCRAPLDAVGTCSGCGLRLTGPLASELWQTMQTADRLIESLRRGAVAANPPAQAVPLPKAPPITATAAPKRRLPAASVPVILFSIGGLCLLVAAIVFVTVAWSSLGLGARTTILIAVTVSIGAAARTLTRRGLRGAAETFWLMTAALITIDLLAAHSADLLGFAEVPAEHALAILGVLLTVLGLGVGTWARRGELGELVVPALTTATGALIVAAAEAWTRPAPAAPTTVSVVGLAGLAGLTYAMRLRRTAYAVTAVAAFAWVGLLFHGLLRADDTTSAGWFTDLYGWPVLAAAATAAAVALLPVLPTWARTTAAAAAEISLVLFALVPGASPDTELLIAAGVVCALAAAAVVTPRIWALPAVALTGIGVVAGALFALVRPLFTILDLPTTGPADDANLDQYIAAMSGQPSTWTAILVAGTVVLAALSLTSLLPPTARTTGLRTWCVLAPAVLALGVTTALLETGPTLLVAVTAWAATGAVLGILATTIRGAWAPPALALATYLIVLGLRLAVPSHLLAGLLAAVIAGVLAVAATRTAGRTEQAVLAGGVVLTAGFSATHLVYLVGGRGDAAGIALALVAAAAGLLARPVARSSSERVTVEVVALLCGLAATSFPLHDATITIVLTIVGSAVALVAVLEPDRDLVAWLGTVVLGVAALLRVDADLALPELATAPAAALLLVAGVRRIQNDETVSSIRALGSGLTLALLPSLLIALDEPVSVRSAVVGAAAAAALAGGIARRWAAPFLAGAGTLGILALRHLGPVAEALPRWISLGSIGVVLLIVAITWEARRRDLDVAQRYLTALR